MKKLMYFLLVSLSSFFIANNSFSASTEKTTMTLDGLTIIDHLIGTGATAKSGQQVSVHYTGWLYDANAKDHKGQKFDSSVDRNQPFQFILGAGQVIKGWDEGVAGMKVGGKRTLIIPSHLGYGSRGAGGVIPPNAKLMFDVELLEVN
ncbi:MAG: peptidylprolyl isomerase [Ferrovum sp. 34-44-207]|nr:MAG: peptidylprolyl isomerase [Ferrovum sp. 34-44-207]